MQTTDTLHATLKDLMTAIESGDGDGLRAYLAELDRQRRFVGAEKVVFADRYMRT